jgi:ABC-type amino acid transport substrate-binding protein
VLSGLDIEMAHQLALDLETGLQLVPTTAPEMTSVVARGGCDILMGGIVSTPRRAREVSFSRPYLEETLAFVVPDHLRDAYATWDHVRARGTVRIGFPDVPYFQRQLHMRIPSATLVPVTDLGPFFAPGTLPYEALVLSAERGAFLSLMHPGFSVVVPSPGHLTVPIAYGLPAQDEAWAALVNSWLELRSRDGSLDMLVEHWIFGRSSAPPPRRWSVVRNVLHWVD